MHKELVDLAKKVRDSIPDGLIVYAPKGGYGEAMFSVSLGDASAVDQIDVSCNHCLKVRFSPVIEKDNAGQGAMNYVVKYTDDTGTGAIQGNFSVRHKTVTVSFVDGRVDDVFVEGSTIINPEKMTKTIPIACIIYSPSLSEEEIKNIVGGAIDKANGK